MPTKNCQNCGVKFERNKKHSNKQWETVRFCSCSCRGFSVRGISKVHSGSFRKGYDKRRIVQKIGREHYLWIENATYSPKHKWISKHYKKTGICRNCLQSKKTDWANISGKYLRDREDYRELCRKCHFVFDHDSIMNKRHARKQLEAIKFLEK